MCAPLQQHLLHRQQGFAADFVVDRNPLEEALNSLRRTETGEDCEVASRKTKVFATGETSVRVLGHRVQPISVLA